MTSNEIKTFIIGRIEASDPIELYFELFRQLQEDGGNILHIKSVMSRWRCACREVSKEKSWGVLFDETLPQSLYCWNAYVMAVDNGHIEKTCRIAKQILGWDVKAVAEGKHCDMAQFIINALEERRARRLADQDRQNNIK